MNTKLWMKVVLAILVLVLVPVAVVSAAGKVNIERKTGTAVLGVPANLPQRGPAAAPWVFPNNPLGLDKAITPSPYMPLTWKEGWEFAWPNGAWLTWDNNGVNYPNENYDLCWDDVSYRDSKGNWSAWPADGCGDGYSPPGYAPNMDSWMTLGPVSTSGAKSAKMTYKFYLDTEANYDWLGACASADNLYYYCNWVSGWSGGKFIKGTLDLKNVPGYGSMLGDAYVWVGFIFQSDDIIQGDWGYEGAYIDEFALTIK